MQSPAWIELEGLVNLRDVGGIPTTDGDQIKAGQLLRSDNLQSLTDSDMAWLFDFGLTDVIDLRSNFEAAQEGPGPLTAHDRVRIHHHSLFLETKDVSELAVNGGAANGDGAERVEQALPWIDWKPSVEVDNAFASHYLSYLVDRPDSVVASLRTIGEADGATLVHCAAGKDRTGTIVALALILAGAEPEAVVADYVASGDRIQQIVDRLMLSETYADNLRGRPLSSHMTHPETMMAFLEYVETEYGGVPALLARVDWTEEDTERIRGKLRS